MIDISRPLLAFVSALVLAITAALPASGQDFQALVDQAHARFKEDRSGANANYIPILEEVPSELFEVMTQSYHEPILELSDHLAM